MHEESLVNIMEQQERGQFSSKLGFVLAAAGSAVGLGNLWRFPYLAAQHGGGIFLLVYFLLTITFGFSLMVAEIAIGRKTKLSVIGAYRTLNRKFSFLGYLTALCAVLTLPYYCVIGGWVIKYFAGYVTGAGEYMVSDTYFESFRARPVEPILWLLVFVVVTSAIVMMGVQKGIEGASKFLIPSLVVLLIGMAVYVLTMPGALEGAVYYFKPDFTKFSVKTVLAALGQLFYSMSLTTGIMVTYGSYMNPNNNLERSVRQIEFFDTGVAVLSGLMVVPAVYAFSGGDPDAMQSGSGLMFETMPKVFEQTGFGMVLGGIFFLLVFFAALTSAISIMETIVATVCDMFGLHRVWSCVVVGCGAIVIGIPCSLGFGIWEGFASAVGMTILDFMDFITNSMLMPVVALIMSIFIGYVIKPKIIIDEVRISSTFKIDWLFRAVMKYIAPVFLTAILVASILDAAGVFTL